MHSLKCLSEEMQREPESVAWKHHGIFCVFVRAKLHCRYIYLHGQKAFQVMSEVNLHCVSLLPQKEILLAFPSAIIAVPDPFTLYV